MARLRVNHILSGKSRSHRPPSAMCLYCFAMPIALFEQVCGILSLSCIAVLLVMALSFVTPMCRCIVGFRFPLCMQVLAAICAYRDVLVGFLSSSKKIVFHVVSNGIGSQFEWLCLGQWITKLVSYISFTVWWPWFFSGVDRLGLVLWSNCSSAAWMSPRLSRRCIGDKIKPSIVIGA